MKPALSLVLALALTGCASKPKPQPGETLTLAPPLSAFAPVEGLADANDITLFLAGKPVRHGAALSQIQQSVNYRAYLDEIAFKWKAYGARRTSRQTSWSNETLGPIIGSPNTLLYPFGGPDLLYAMSMFPNTSTYVLLGLEPAGSLPALESQDPAAVVDPQLRVRGVQGLRVADTSVMPTLISGNTNAPALAIGLRAAELIRG
ncbi:MAG: hypothetical protein CFE26_24130 [Verrucomicrobiales bacterium VVV1]|nr:MAG: hypothetical protein CFE26_24130 [Verrucomicrobiales bacterium VVV1]